MSKHTILYIRGLGGMKTLLLQKVYLSLLNLFRGDTIYFFEPRWESKQHGDFEKSDAKYRRLDDFFEAHGCPKTIYANSAGAALAIQLAAQHADVITSCHLVCGKVTGHANLSVYHKKRAPSFMGVITKSEQSLSTLAPATAQKFYCYLPKKSQNDGVLDVADMVVPGANLIYLPRLAHNWAIFYAALRYLPKLGLIP